MNFLFLKKDLVCMCAICCLAFGASNCLAQSEGVEAADNAAKEKVVTPEKEEFAYNPAGRRDPFMSLIKKISTTVAKPKVNLGPLGKYELGQLRLMAMLVVDGTPRAMVKAPDGKSYTVKNGDLVGPNGGVVVRIETKKIEVDKITGQRIEKSPDRIVIVETGVDSYTGKMIKEERYIEM